MKNLIKITVVIIIIFILASKVQAQTEDLVKLKHAIGAGAGFTTGYGLSYRYTPNRFGAQINFAPYVNKETKRYSIGLTFLCTLIENKIANLYIYQGNHYYYNSELVTFIEPLPPYAEYGVRETEGFFNNGVGFGLEFLIEKKISFNLMGGYAAYDNFQQLNVTGEAAVYYKF